MDSCSVLDETSDQSGSDSHVAVLSVYSEKIILQSNQIMPYNPSNMQKFYEKYVIKRVFYTNDLACSRVSLLEDRLGNKYAAKEIMKKKILNQHFHDFAKNEMTLHYSLSRLTKNIVKMEDYFEDDDRYLMVMEYSYDPDYFQDLLENRISGIPNEGILRLYSYDILSAIKIVHDQGIIHCDIKPQNFLIFRQDDDHVEDAFSCICMNEELSEGEKDKIKLSDFGLAHVINQGQDKAFMMYRTGSNEYKAPEVKDNCYVDKSIDIWSFGISLYQMAIGYLPTAIKKYKYGTGPIPFFDAHWKELQHGELIKDLIVKCLKINSEERITAKEALEHPWFKV